MGKQRPIYSTDREPVAETSTEKKFGFKGKTSFKSQKTLKTKIPIERPSGRPSVVESIMLNELIRNAAVLKGWLIVNNRVATGEAVNSIKVQVVRSKIASSFVSNKVSTSGSVNVGGAEIGNALDRAKAIAKASDVGFVTGRILGAPHLKFALQGRTSGTPPPTQDILNWMLAKGVGFSDSRFSLAQQASFIAQSIGRQGTMPPHFDANIRTQMVRVSAAKVVKNLARVFPKFVGDRYVKGLVALGELWDNIDIRRQSPEQQQFDEFI